MKGKSEGRAGNKNIPLATIELKFALLRERLYVEKMDLLAWEGGMNQACMRHFYPLC